MPSIIGGALAGLGEQAANIGGAMFKAELDRDARQQDSDLALARAKTLEEFKAGLATKGRTAQVERINAETGRIADERVGQKRGIINAGIADPAAWTPEMQAAVDQSLAQDREGIVNSSRTRRDAAVRTGDIKPETAATIDSREEVASVRADAQRAIQDSKQTAFMEKLAYMQDRADKDRASRELIAAMRKLGGGEGGEGAEPAKIKAAKIYLEQVNKDRSAKGLEPIEFEEAYSVANYAPRADAEQSTRARVALALTKEDPRLLKDKAKLRQAVDDAMSAIDASGPTGKPAAPAAPATPKPAGAASASAKPEVSKVQGLPAGSSIGAQTPKGWEVKDSTGKLIGYVRG